MSRITFLDNASRSKNNWWRYLLTIILTWGGGKIFAIIFPIFLSIVFYLMLSGFDAVQVNSITSNPLFILLRIGIGEIILFLIFYLCIRFIHKRKLISLINTCSKVNWGKILKGAGIWFTILVITSTLSLIFSSDARVTFNLNTFIILLILSLIIFPIQASFEELFFRGYLMQGLGLLTKKPVIPLLITSIVFAIPHYFNIYYINGATTWIGVDWAIQAFIMGIALGIIVLGENRLETAMGVHIINNLFGAVIIYNTSTGLFGNLPAIITVASHGVPNPISEAIVSILFLSILLTVIFWNKKDKVYNIFKTGQSTEENKLKISKRHYLIVIIVIIALMAIFTLHITVDNTTDNKSVSSPSIQAYSAYGVSFNYLGNWDVSTDSNDGDNVIVVSKDDSTQFEVQIMPESDFSDENPLINTQNYTSNISDHNVISQMQNNQDPGWAKISNRTLKIDGCTAYEEIFRVNDPNFSSEIMKVEQIDFVKNGKVYDLMFQAPYNDFDKEKQGFNLVLNSFKVQ